MDGVINGVEVGSLHGITGDDAVESQISFPINCHFCLEINGNLIFFFFLNILNFDFV